MVARVHLKPDCLVIALPPPNWQSTTVPLETKYDTNRNLATPIFPRLSQFSCVSFELQLIAGCHDKRHLDKLSNNYFYI